LLYLAECVLMCSTSSKLYVMTTADQYDSPEQPVFRVGDTIPKSGIYRVYHSAHRKPHEVTLLSKETFPPCMKCGHSVSFELVKAIPRLEDKDFQIRLYAIPDEESEAA